jgi:hypothetical protein
MILWLSSCGVLFTRQARIQKRGVAGPGDKSMMEQGMVFVTVTRRLSGSHSLGIMLGELPCAQGDVEHSLLLSAKGRESTLK